MSKFYRLLSVLLLLASHRVQAQSPDSLRQAINHLFAPLDKCQVPVSYLAEYGNRFVSLTPFDGSLTDSSLSDLATLSYLRTRLQSAHLYGTDTLPDVPACAPPDAEVKTRYNY